jgi:hypothetical protein
MPANAGIHVFRAIRKEDVDGRDKSGHDGDVRKVPRID